jgi:serine/threonine protein kinase
LLLKDDSRDGNVDVKLCDMGIAAILPQEGSLRYGCIPVSNLLTEVCGTTLYMSPEMLSRKPYSSVVDEWSCGVTMYVLMFGEFPYRPSKKEDEDSREVMRDLICSSHVLVQPAYTASAGLPQPSNLACDLVAALLNRDARVRVTAADALKYEFLEQFSLESGSNEAELDVPLPPGQLDRLPTLLSTRNGMSISTVGKDFVKDPRPEDSMENCTP